MKGWLDNYNDSKVSIPEGFQGEGYSTKGRNYSPAWGGQFQMGGYVYPVNYVPEAQMGTSIPGAVGFTYARTNDPAPSNGPYAKKTKASAQDGKWLGNKLNNEGYITSETKGGNRISFTGNQRTDEWINKQIDSGKFGFDPKTGATFPLKKPVKGMSKEDKFIGSKQYHDLQAPQGFNTKDQIAEIEKLPKWQQDIINSSNKERRKVYVRDDMQKAFQNPIMYAPGAIALAPLAATGLMEAGMFATPYIEGALATQLPGMAAVPGATVGNAVTAGFAGHGLANVGPDTVEFVKNPSLENAGAVGMDVLEIAPIVGPGVKTIGEGVNYAKNVAPKINKFSKTAVNDVSDTFRYLKNKQLSKPKVKKTINKYLEEARTPIREGEINSIEDFDNYHYDIARQMNDIYSMGPGVSKTADFNRRIQGIFENELKGIRSGEITDPEKLTSIINNMKQLIPSSKEVTKDVISSINKSQRNLIFNPETDPGLIKNYFKNLKNLEGKEANFSLTPKERETLDAIRELGKYKTEAQDNLTRLIHDPDAMSGINKAILNLDDDVVRSVIGIPKSDLLSSYQRNVPLDVRSKAADLISNPMSTNQVMNLQQENLLYDPFVAKTVMPSSQNRSLLQKFGDNYVKTFSKYDIEPLEYTPTSLIGSARTDYRFKVPEIVDADGSTIAFGTPYFDRSNRTVGQLKEALKKVEAGNKGDSFIGSGSLSSDSYPLTLDSGLFMMNRGVVSPGFSGRFNRLNDWGYTNQAPNLVLKDINSKILELEKLSGKKFPKATYNPEERYQYIVPEIYFTKLKKGGVIKDDMGQWAHPGEITEINSNDITMQGVPYDVLGISDTGDTKLMKPGKNYKFKGKKVTEYPMAKNGLRQEQKGLVNLDNLTNFTNYNTKQPGGWLDKY